MQCHQSIKILVRVRLRKMKCSVFQQLFRNLRYHVSSFEQNNVLYFPSLDPQPIQLPAPGAYAASSWPKEGEEMKRIRQNSKSLPGSHLPSSLVSPVFSQANLNLERYKSFIAPPFPSPSSPLYPQRSQETKKGEGKLPCWPVPLSDTQVLSGAVPLGKGVFQLGSSPHWLTKAVGEEKQISSHLSEFSWLLKLT